MVKKVLSKVVLGSAALVAGQLAYVVKRDLPSFEGFDASGAVGNPELPTVTIAVLGDSTTTGPGLTRPEDIWIRQAAAMLADRYHVVIESVGVGGSKAKDVAIEQVPRVGNVDIAIVAAGSNDALRARSVNHSEHWLHQTAAQLLGRAEVVILAGVGDLADIPRLPWPLSAFARSRGFAMDAAHRRVAATSHRILKVPIFEIGAPRFKETDDTFSPDLFHVNEKGHQIWAETLLPYLERAIAKIGR